MATQPVDSPRGVEGVRGHARTLAWGALLLAVGLLGLYRAKSYNYLLFHSLAEMFSILIATSIFVVAWNARHLHEGDYFTFLGIAFLFVGALDLIHTLVYDGMGVFPGHGVNPPTQLWISARYIQSLALLAAPLLIGRRLRPELVLLGMGALFTFCLLTIFRWQVFPDCFLSPGGLTQFKIVSEYVICGVFLAAAGAWLWRRDRVERTVANLLVASLVVSVGQEIAFTLYDDPYGRANYVGHCLKIVSFYLVYKAIVETALARPYDLLFFDLVRKERELKRSNADLEQFASVVSHDLRSPLMSAGGFAELLQRHCGSQLGPEAGELLNYLRESLLRMKYLITSLLKYARAGHGGLQVAECSAELALKSAIRSLKVVLEEARGEVVHDPLPPVQADEALLSQVFQNLLENAIKYRGDRPPRIHVRAWDEGGEQVFAVRDNGIGIPPEHVGRVFEVFQRVNTNDSPEAGLGIGLATCKRIIEKHGGRIWVESEAGSGSTFHFALPR